MRRSRKRKNGILHSSGQRQRKYKRRKKIIFFDIIIITILVGVFLSSVKKEEEIPVVEKYSEEHQKQIINEELENKDIPLETEVANMSEVAVPEKQSGSIIINKITMSEIEEEKTLVSFLVQNRGNSDESSNFPIIFKNANGEKIIKTYVNVPVVKAGQQTKVNIVLDKNIREAKSTELTDEQ